MTGADTADEARQGPPPGVVRLTDGLGGSHEQRAGFLGQIERCRREVAQWPEWMRGTTIAPKWMEGWDD